MDKIKIVLLGIYYPFAILSYFREALESRNDIELYCVGPDTGTWIPWNHGMNLSPKYVKTVNIPLPRDMRNVSYKMVERLLPWKPHLYLNVDAGFCLSDRPTNAIYAVVATDSHVMDYSWQRNISDYFFNMHQHYSQEGDLILPYAYSEKWHKPMDIEKIYDACLIGLHYEHRNVWIDLLQKHGVNVYYSIGDVFDDYRLKNCQSKVGLNWSTLNDMNARTFELLAMGIPSVQYKTPDMDYYFKDQWDYIGISNMHEAVEGVLHLLENPDLAETIAKRGLEAVKPHSYENRVTQILETVGLLP